MSQDHQSQPTLSPIDSTSAHILYLEDEVGLARLLKRKLELAGYKVDLAQDGEQGLAMYDPAIHDLIVADYKLPIYNGLEVLRILATKGPLPPTIILTGSGDAQTAVAAMKLGADDYIIKDMQRQYLEQLPTIIDRVLLQRRLDEDSQIPPANLLVDEREQRMLTETLRWAGAVVLSSTLNYDEVLDRIVEQVSRITAHDATCLMLIEGDNIRVARWIGYGHFGLEAAIASAVFRFDDIPPFQQAKQTRLPVTVPHVKEDDAWISASRQNWIKSYVTIPILAATDSPPKLKDKQETVLGFLNVDSAAPGFFSQVDAERLHAFTTQAAIALVNARLYDQARGEVTERMRALKQERNFVSAILDTAEALVMIFNRRGRIIRFNRACERVTGYMADEVRGRYLWDFLLPPEDIALVKQSFEQLQNSDQRSEYETGFITKEGKRRFVVWSNTILPTSDGSIEYIISTGIDITQRKLTEERLMHTAWHDALTDLPNRTLFMENLERSIEKAKEDDKYLFAVLFLDLDRFKVINDSLGHLAGDQLLIAVARRLELHLRPDDMVARLGGDEFAILLDGISDINEATSITSRIQDELARPVKIGEHEVFTTASIGIALSSIGYDWPQDILRDADTTLYQAKARGRARHEVFHIGLRTHAVAVWQLESELRRAIENGDFALYYQPIISLSSGKITGVEALLRWQHPEQGIINPGEFIPLAEETGLIVPIGAWVLRTACAQTKAWHDAGYDSLRIAVNVSPLQFRKPAAFSDSLEDKALPKLVEEVLEGTGLPAEYLALEITENFIEFNSKYNQTIIDDIRKLGVKMAIDDFGIGSSLSFFKHFSIDILKIDQSFIKDMTHDSGDAAFIQAIIAMAHSLKLRVVAEGVSTQAQLDFLQAQKCDEIQGFLFSKPLPTAQLTALLQHQKRLPLEPHKE